MSAWLVGERIARFEAAATNADRVQGSRLPSIARSPYVAPRSSTAGERSTAERVIHVTQRFDAPPQHVFAAWLEPDLARRWLFAMATRPIDEVAIDARVGGAFRLARAEGDEHRGRYLDIVPHRRLAFRLVTSLLPATHTRVHVDIVTLRGRSTVALSHAGVPREFVRTVRERWLGMLYGLAVALDALF
jgi:uncharacterized protein YndB with AHSA1/START domain